jgi:hypothetical protein
MYLLREESNVSLPQIGEVLGGRDHTTVMYGCDKVAGMLEEDDRFRRQVLSIKERLYGPGAMLPARMALVLRFISLDLLADCLAYLSRAGFAPQVGRQRCALQHRRLDPAQDQAGSFRFAQEIEQHAARPPRNISLRCSRGSLQNRYLPVPFPSMGFVSQVEACWGGS